MIIDCISDLHGFRPKLEGGDLLIVAGDLTARDTRAEHVQITDWMHAQKYKCVVFIAGNHDGEIQDIPRRAGHVYYLCDSGCEFEYEEREEGEFLEGFALIKRRLKIWGSPWTKTFPLMNPKCKAFTKDTEEELAERWSLIPDDVDILITHGPPKGRLDVSYNEDNCGSQSLFDRVNERIPYHIFGHIHEGRGIYQNGLTRYINCTHVDENYRPVYNAVRIEL